MGEFALSGNGVTLVDMTRIAARPFDALRIIASGELDAQGADHRCIVRLNGRDSGYHSFIAVDSGADQTPMPAWDDAGLVVGRNSSCRDARFAIDLSITSAAATRLRIALGSATFTHGDEMSVTYLSHGYISEPRGIETIEFGFTGGIATGSLTCYTLL